MRRDGRLVGSRRGITSGMDAIISRWRWRASHSGWTRQARFVAAQLRMSPSKCTTVIALIGRGGAPMNAQATISSMRRVCPSMVTVGNPARSLVTGMRRFHFLTVPSAEIWYPLDASLMGRCSNFVVRVLSRVQLFGRYT
jgi:hypothetical protein